mgnify:CR=1 FL=1
MEQSDIDRSLVSVSISNPLEGTFSLAYSKRLVRAVNHGYADLQLAYLTALRDSGCTYFGIPRRHSTKPIGSLTIAVSAESRFRPRSTDGNSPLRKPNRLSIGSTRPN